MISKIKKFTRQAELSLHWKFTSGNWIAVNKKLNLKLLSLSKLNLLRKHLRSEHAHIRKLKRALRKTERELQRAQMENTPEPAEPPVKSPKRNYGHKRNAQRKRARARWTSSPNQPRKRAKSSYKKISSKRKISSPPKPPSKRLKTAEIARKRVSHDLAKHKLASKKKLP